MNCKKCAASTPRRIDGLCDDCYKIKSNAKQEHEFKPGDRVIIMAVDPLLHPVAFENGLRVGGQRTLRYGPGLVHKTLVLPFVDLPGSVGMVIKRYDGVPSSFPKGIEIALVDSPRQGYAPVTATYDAEETEGQRMMKFFKSSAHDPGASW